MRDGQTADRISDARSSKVRILWAASAALALATAILFWGVNALVMRSALDDARALRAFLGNLQVFAVAITSASAASVAWAGYGLGRAREQMPGCICLPARPWALSLLASLAGLACGLGISWGLVASAAVGPTRDVIVGGLRLAGVLGTAFALAGALVSDVSVGLAKRISRGTDRTAALPAGLVIVILNSLWAGAAVVAIGLARAQAFRP